eukprot:g12262.t1
MSATTSSIALLHQDIKNQRVKSNPNCGEVTLETSRRTTNFKILTNTSGTHRQKEMENDDSTFDLVEREIQRAEELLARDLTLINDVDSNWTPSKGRKMPQNPRLPETRRKELIANLRAGRNDDSGKGPQDVSDPDANLESFIITGSHKKKKPSKKTTPDDSNRYKDRSTRNALINKLLSEHKNKKDGSAANVTRTAVVDTKPSAPSHQSYQAQELSNRSSKVDMKTPSSIHIKRSGSVVVNFNEEVNDDGFANSSPSASGHSQGARQSRVEEPYKLESASRGANRRLSDSSSRKHDKQRGQMLRTSNLETESTNDLHTLSKGMHSQVQINNRASRYKKTEKKRALGRSLQRSANHSRHISGSKVATSSDTGAKWASRASRPFSRKTKEDVKRELEDKRKQECTFKPKINPMPSTSKLANETREQRLKRLAEDKTAKIARREQSRVAKEQADVKKNCTFKPKTNKSFVSKRDGKVDWSSVEQADRARIPLQDRLHHEADERAATREKMKRNLEAEEMSSYPFRPSINPRSHAILNMNAYKPIHER